MEKSYNSNYLKIYFWKTFRIITGILSMTIVIPLISSNTSIYGIYVLCISISSFLQYTDLGFLSAGQKYASEYFALKDLKNEIKMLSFVHFIMLIFLIICICVILIFCWKPDVIIPDLNTSSTTIASSLFFILAITSPFILLLRYAQSVFTIRIQDDVYQKIDLAVNILKIGCVYFFYENNTIDIVSYFIFIQLLNFLTVLVSFYCIKKMYDYDLILVFKSFRFDIDIYDKTKLLAVSSMISTVSWIVFFQLDSFIISKTFGITSVAIYAIPYFLLMFISNLYNTIYYPFLFRFNHFIVAKNHDRLYDFINKIFELTFPIFLLPVTVLILLMKPLIIGWVGMGYNDSILIGQILMASTFFLFITMPYSYLLLSLEKTKILNYNSVIIPIVFLTLIIVLKNVSSLLSLAIAKTATFFISSIFLYFSFKISQFKFYKFILNRILSISFSFMILFLTYYLFFPYLVNTVPKNTLSMVKTISFGLIMFTISFFVYIALNKNFIFIAKNILKSILPIKTKDTL
ncbi:Polysaccharide biosynthesis protein [Flavobacterium fluvii]|uniref:Polysaccharide biosynthesis protein n=1 Tax=Flavobacterium fluvii TaxID=468056 RepID=A0A1M5IN68_9FLAO|nr:oligosaccharide flippase family protein [Flavobacterium fluvii]SHG29686.1 Polysaccharide biosynthesis protein [Flavobacterium fluvii]